MGWEFWLLLSVLIGMVVFLVFVCGTQIHQELRLQRLEGRDATLTATVNDVKVLAKTSSSFDRGLCAVREQMGDLDFRLADCETVVDAVKDFSDLVTYKPTEDDADASPSPD